MGEGGDGPIWGAEGGRVGRGWKDGGHRAGAWPDLGWLGVIGGQGRGGGLGE